MTMIDDLFEFISPRTGINSDDEKSANIIICFGVSLLIVFTILDFFKH
jgi:hypothetical protein